VDILVTDLDEPIIGFLFNFTFDSSVLALQGVAEGSFLSQVPSNFNADPVSPEFQTITNFLTAGSSMGTSGILATLTFLAQSPGPGSLTLLPVGLGDFFFLETAFVTERDPLVPLIPTLNPTDAHIDVLSPTSVPEPSTLGLMGVGLLALARRLRRKTPAAR
jgi:hypothetical protein